MKPLNRYLVTLPVILVAVLVAQMMQPYFNDTNVVMVYMLAVVVVAFLLGPGPAVMACLLSVLLYDFINVPPYFQLTSELYEYGVTVLVMLITVGIIATLAGRLKQRAAESAGLYALSAELADCQTGAGIVECLQRHLAGAFRARIELQSLDDGTGCEGGARISTPTIVGREVAMKIVLPVEGQAPHVLDVRAGLQWLGSRDQREYLDAMVGQCIQALERISLRDRVQEKEILIQKESLRNSILNTISHDLRTPLASIIGASSSLQSGGDQISAESGRRLHAIIHAEALHMRHMVDNLLDLARLQGGDLQLAYAWEALEEIVGSAAATSRRRTGDHEILVDMPHDLPLIRCDSMLIERVVINLLENAVKYSPAGSVVTLSARFEDEQLLVRVANPGGGIPLELREKVFEPFYRLQPGVMSGGGLGLTICRSIVDAHGGRIWISTAETGETIVQFTLPLTARLPDPPREALTSETGN